MRQLNAKFLLILAGSTVLLAGGMFLLHRAQSGRIARALRDQAERAEKQGKTDQEVKYLARYLTFVPDDNEVRAELGRILASPEIATSPRARERALFVLEQVLLREPERHESRRLLIRIAFQLGRLDTAGTHLEALEKELPNDGEVLRLRGQWHEARNNERDQDLVKAVASYQKAIKIVPGEIDSYVRLAYLLRRQPDLKKPRKPGEAALDPDEIMKALVTNNAKSPEAYLARWQYRKAFHSLKEAKQISEAGEDVVSAQKLAPDEARVISAAAELAQMKGDLSEARKQLSRGMELFPQDAAFYQTLARVELEEGKLKITDRPETERKQELARSREVAIKCLRKGIQAVGAGQGQNDLIWTLTNLLIDDDKTAEAEDQVAMLRKVRFSQPGVDFLAARIAIKKGQWVEATRVLERARPLLETEDELARQADSLLVECYERLGETTGRVMAVYQRLLKRDPNAVAARQAMAASYFALGRLDEALEEYRQIASQPIAPANVHIQIARLQFLRNLQRPQRDWKEVEDALSKADPKAVEVVVLKSQVLLEQGKPDQARQDLEKARDQEPKRIEWWAALAALAERQKEPDEAKRLLTAAQKQCPDSMMLRLAWAHYWAARGGDEAKAAIPKLADKMDQLSPEDQASLILGLVEAQCRLNNFAEAEQLWSRMAKLPRFAGDVRIQQLWFDLALKAGSEDAITQALAAIQRIEEGQGPLWHYGEALRLLRQARQGKKEVLDAARTHLEAAAKARPSWPSVVLARAQLEELLGQPEQAIGSYRRAIELGERSPQAVRGLTQLLHRKGRWPEAEEQMRQVEKQMQLSPDLQRLAADISLQNQDPARAISLALKAVSADSNDYRDFLWLGQVQAARGNLSKKEAEEVEKNLRRATELGSAMPETWIALVRFYTAVKREKDAEAAMTEAKAKLPADQVSLVLAQCHEMLGRPDEARKHYEAALVAQAKDVVVLRSATSFYLRMGQLREAESLLRTIVDRKIEATESDSTWARRSLALAIANHADYRRFGEALALVGLRLSKDDEVIEDRKVTGPDLEEYRTRAKILVTANRSSLRKEAIKCLEKLNGPAQTGEDVFLLAQLHEAQGSQEKVRELLTRLTVGANANPLGLAQAARSYLRLGNKDDARRCIERLRQIEKSQQVEEGLYGSIELWAQWQEATGDGAGAVQLLQKHAQRQDASPEMALLLAGCLGRQNRLAEALQVCDGLWTTCPPDAVGGTCVAALRASKATADQYARVERGLKEALKKQPGNPVLLLQLADVRDLQERYDDAAVIYQQILARDQGNVVALNNLAWLLAQQPKTASEAMTLITRAIDLAGPRAELLDTRALVQMALGRPDLAIGDLERSNKETPSGPRYFHLARAHQSAKNLDAAAAALTQAKDLKLRPEQLHPVERVAFRKMLEELK